MPFSDDDVPTRAAKARTIASLGAMHLASLVQSGGRFVYAYDAGTGKKSKGYNILRHAGSIWSIFHVARNGAAGAGLEAAGALALEHLQQRYLRPFGKEDALCITSKDRVKLGGAALAILALLAAPPGPLTEQRREAARRLGVYLLSQEHKGGDFYHKRIYLTGEVTNFRSEYYTGEALFALACLHDAGIPGPWLERCMPLLQGLGRRDYGLREQSHWMLYALEAFHRFRPEPWLGQYAGRIAADIATRPEYRSWDRSTPIACRSEGLLAYLRLAAKYEGDPLPLAPESALAIVEENLNLQSKYRTVLGGFMRGAGSQEVRIDYIQHNISGFCDYALLINPAGQPGANSSTAVSPQRAEAL